ncbi:MFS transporter [Nocardia sp. CA-120079]|uniref:MFS transporter n=1 Tax=Nocardia sp. CA-120079 TaxID=3239974 RepID=UPI003D998520
MTERIDTRIVPTMKRVNTSWCLTFGLAWTGVWMAQLTPFQYLLPVQINETLGSAITTDETSWRSSVLHFGIISGLSAVCLAVGLPLTGALSDRTRGRFGRRRPWIVIGGVVLAFALAMLANQHTTLGIAVWWCVAMLGFCAAAASLTALIKDRVPHEQRGTVSGWMSMAQAAGLIVGLGSVAIFALTADTAYPVLAVLLILCLLPFTLSRATEPATINRPVSLSLQPSSGSAIRLLMHHDFRWAMVGRVTVNFGNALATCLLIYFLQFHLRIEDPSQALLVLTVAYIVSVLSVSVLGGWLSDRYGRRKPFIVGSAILQTLSAVMFVFSESLWAATAAVAVIGAGYGCYMGIDQALGADVLPDANHSGKELGIMNIALTVPPAVSPLFAAVIVELFDGSFTELFISAGILTLLGGLVVLRIRSVN